MKLYLVEIGGMREGNLFESHEVHAMVALNEEQLLHDCEARFCDSMQAAHIDGWVEIELETCRRTIDQERECYFIAELGRNSDNSIREEHDYRFLSAKNWREAVQIAKLHAPGWHVDTCINLDELAEKAGYCLHRDLFDNLPQPKSQSRYVRFLVKKVS